MEYFPEIAAKLEEQLYREIVKELCKSFGWIKALGINLWVIMEGWGFQENGQITFLKKTEPIASMDYETWITIYFLRNGQIICKNREREMLCACVKVLKISSGDKDDILKIDTRCLEKLKDQIEEIFEDWEGDAVREQKDCRFVEKVIERAKTEEILFETDGDCRMEDRVGG